MPCLEPAHPLACTLLLFYDRCYLNSRHKPQIPFAVVALLGSLVLEDADVLGLKKIALPWRLIHYGTSLASFSLSGPRVKESVLELR